ncbi:MAG: hypothetical protein WCT03_11180 [Candidatus Obscuribacterales bacterium]|jgi:hypothetical protein
MTDTKVPFDGKYMEPIPVCIKRAIEHARRNGEFAFDCNGMQMAVSANSSAKQLEEDYWAFKHEEGIRNGTIVTGSVPTSSF